MVFSVWGKPHWIWDEKLNTLGYFLFFLPACLADSWPGSLIHLNLRILKNRCNFRLGSLLNLGNTFLEQIRKLKTSGYLLLFLLFSICNLAAQWRTFDYYQENSFIHPMLITAFELLIFGPKVTESSWISTLNWVPSRVWLQCLNQPSFSPQIAENTLLRLAFSFSKMWKCPQYLKQVKRDPAVAFRLV